MNFENTNGSPSGMKQSTTILHAIHPQLGLWPGG